MFKAFTASLAVVAAQAQLQDLPEFAMTLADVEKLFSGSFEDVLEAIKLKGCMGCTAGINLFDKVMKEEWVQNALLFVASEICTVFKITKPTSICPQIVNQYGQVLLDVVFNELITRDRICNESMGLCTHPRIEQIDVRDVVNNILATKPESLKNDDFIDNIYEQIKQEGGTDTRDIILAAHISDLHMDLLYKEGTNADCEGYLCCREDVGYPTGD